jgi:large subunit ribosomal protein L3
MINGILGKKVGMTHIFEEDGKRMTVTLIEAGPCVVHGIRTAEKNGYSAVQLGFDPRKEKGVRKPEMGYLKSKGLKPMRFVREVGCDDLSSVKIGDQVTNSAFQRGDFVDVIGTSKGKGYQGGVKRCGWKGGMASHGNMSHRVPGSIGASSFPSRVHKGHPFPGQMGFERETVQNLKVLIVDQEAETIAVNGAVPGAKGSYVIIRFAKKKPMAPRKTEEELKALEAEARAKSAAETSKREEKAKKEAAKTEKKKK